MLILIYRLPYYLISKFVENMNNLCCTEGMFMIKYLMDCCILILYLVTLRKSAAVTGCYYESEDDRGKFPNTPLKAIPQLNNDYYSITHYR